MVFLFIEHVATGKTHVLVSSSFLHSIIFISALNDDLFYQHRH